ncbi:Tn3 family transposase [Nonomuraea sp. NPDC049684]|uniref:Tn3 family transposase n=1 Tax=Nonomuraea sp. NPDC049684 TaxID=3364356 RepID=UPI003792E6CE
MPGSRRYANPAAYLLTPAKWANHFGLTRMADAGGISCDILAWTAEWYVREETLRAANLARWISLHLARHVVHGQLRDVLEKESLPMRVTTTY